MSLLSRLLLVVLLGEAGVRAVFFAQYAFTRFPWPLEAFQLESKMVHLAHRWPLLRTRRWGARGLTEPGRRTVVRVRLDDPSGLAGRSNWPGWLLRRHRSAHVGTRNGWAVACRGRADKTDVRVLSRRGSADTPHRGSPENLGDPGGGVLRDARHDRGGHHAAHRTQLRPEPRRRGADALEFRIVALDGLADHRARSRVDRPDSGRLGCVEHGHASRYTGDRSDDRHPDRHVHDN